jgi:glucose/arabinose dehydrogenase
MASMSSFGFFVALLLKPCGLFPMQQINSLPDVGKPFRLPMAGAVRWFAARADKLVPLLLAAFCLSLVSVEGATLPGNFTETTIAAPSGGNWNEAVGVLFEENGRMYVWERGGRVWIKEYGASTWSSFIDISEEVGGWRDFGLLGFVLDPNFRVNGYIYLMYVVDRHHLMDFGTPSYNPASNQYFAATIGRITRYTARSSDGFRTVDPASRRILLGETRQTGIPILHESHGIGTLVFGADGTLLASCGDGASYSSTDTGNASETYYSQGLTDGIIKPKENIGAYRSQLLDSHNGKVLRLDPATGDGLPSNPFFDSANPRSARSRVWALGLRNPCRMTLRPETGSHNKADGNPGVLCIGDVGWNTWEDLHVAGGPGKNFGWPAFEGLEVQSSYFARNIQNLDAPNPFFGVGGCTQQYLYFNQLIKQDSLNPVSFTDSCGNTIPGSIPRFIHTRPAIDWRHGQTVARTGIYDGSGNAAVVAVGAGGSPVSGSQFPGNCSIGGVWYTANDFPAQYKNTYFHADYGATWIQNFVFDANDRPTAVRTFLSGGGGVVALATHPIDGGLYYISWSTTLRKIAYVPGGNLPPTAVVSANKYYGPGPLAVQFTGSGSTDPEGLPLTHNWNFGDGTPNSTAANPSHTFNAASGVPTKYTVALTVTDSALQTSIRTVIISVNNTPPSVTLTSPVDGTQYPLTGDTVYNLTANVADAEFPDGQLKYEWQTILHHNNHEHAEPIDTNHVTTTVISPVGCDGNTYFYRIVLTVTDPAGLSTQREVSLYPDCGGSNTAPTVSNIADQTINQGASTGAIAFTVGDAETAASALTVSGSSSNPTLVPNGNIVFGGSGANRTVTVTPAAGQSGSATITVTVSDGTLTASDPFVLTVNSGGAPTYLFSEGFEGTGYENSGWSEAGTPNEDYTTSVLHGAQSLNCVGAQYLWRTFRYADSFNLYFRIRWNAWADYSNIIAWDDIGWSTVGGIWADDNRISIAHGSAYAVGTTSIAVNTTYHVWAEWARGSGNNGTMKLYVSGDGIKPGTPEASITIGTGGGTERMYMGPFAAGPNVVFDRILVDDVPIGSNPDGTQNQTPTLGDIPNQTINEDSSTGAIAFTVGDAETSASALTLSGSSSNPTLVPNGNIVFGGSGANRTATVTPAANQSGSATITVTVSDGSLTASDPFVLTVNAVNDAPTISNIADQTVSQGTATGALAFTIGDAETAASALTVSGSSSNPTLVPNGNIVFGGSGANRTVTVTPAANQAGSATITVTVSDGTLTAGDSFVLTVNPASNTAPTISDISNRTVNEDGTTGAIAFTIGDAETAASALAVSGSSSNPTLVPNGNIVFGGSGANRTVTVTPAANQSGGVTITVTVSDGALSASDPFVLTVNAVNDAPTISNIADQTINQGASTGAIAFTVGDAETAASALTVSGSSSNPTLVPNGNIVFGGSGANRTVTVTPVATQSGSATITVTVSDGTLTASDPFVLTVNSGSAPTYLFSEGFEGAGYENSGWSEAGTPNEDYTTSVLHGAQSLNCVGAQYLWRTFRYADSFNLYFRIRWNAWADYSNIIAWDDIGWSTVGGIWADDNRISIVHGSAYAVGTTSIAVNTTYHVWVEWTRGSGNNGTMKLYVSGDGIKPGTPEASVTTGTGGGTERMYMGPFAAGPNVVFDRILVDDVSIGSNPPDGTQSITQSSMDVVEPPKPASVRLLGVTEAGHVTLSVEGEVGQTVAVEVSGNLTDWTRLTTLENTDGTLEFTDVKAAGQTPRFYRAVSVSKSPIRAQ